MRDLFVDVAHAAVHRPRVWHFNAPGLHVGSGAAVSVCPCTAWVTTGDLLWLPQQPYRALLRYGGGVS